MRINSINDERYGLTFSCTGAELPAVIERLKNFDDGICPECGGDLHDEWEWEYYEGVMTKIITAEYCGCGFRRIYEED